MEIDTVFGVKWRIPSLYDISLVLSIILIVVLLLLIMKYYLKLKDKKAHMYQLLLFKANQLGLSSYQIKILNGIVNTSKLRNPNLIFNNPAIFESTIGKFLSFLSTQDELEESLNSIFKDIIMIYQKLYNPAEFKKPLDDIRNIEKDQIFYLKTEDQHLFLGKLIFLNRDFLSLNLLSGFRKKRKLKAAVKVHVSFWRTGDAEYIFDSLVLERYKNNIQIALPPKIKRGQETRYPSINMSITCYISFVAQDESVTEESGDSGRILVREGPANNEYIEIESELLKLNINEALLKVPAKLLYDYEYNLNFKLNGVKLKIGAVIVSEKPLKEKGFYHYIFKFKKIPDDSKKVLHDYLTAHLQ